MILKNKTFVIYTALFILLIAASFMVWFFYFNPSKQLKDIGVDYYSGNLDQAISKLEDYIKKYPNSADAYILLATSYSQKGSVSFNEQEYSAKALEAAKKSLELKPNNAAAYTEIGYAYEIAQKYPEAQENYLKAIELDPKISTAYSALGHSYDLQGDLIKAEEWYKKALTINQNNFHALVNMARISIRNNKPDEAEEYLLTSLKNNPDNRTNAESYSMLAVIEKSFRNDSEKANQYLEKSLSYDQNVPQVWVQMGMNDLGDLPYIQIREDWESGVLKIDEYAQKALSINKNQTSAYMLLALLSSYIGDYRRAEEMRLRGLEAVDLDITLGQQEKDSTKGTLEGIKVLWDNKI